MMDFTLHSMVSDHWCGLAPLYMVPCDNKEKEDHDVKIHETVSQYDHNRKWRSCICFYRL